MNEVTKRKILSDYYHWHHKNQDAVPADIGEYWINILGSALTDKVATIRGDLDHLEIYMGFGMPFTMLEKLAVLNLPSLSLPASREENDRK